jgi:hypothetical protein
MHLIFTDLAIKKAMGISHGLMLAISESWEGISLPTALSVFV